MTINKTGKYKTNKVCKGGNGGPVWTIAESTEFTVTQIDSQCLKPAKKSQAFF